MRLRELNNKRVLVWGAGREATAFLRACERKAVMADIVVADEVDEPGRMLSNFPILQISNELIEQTDVIVRSPGVSIYKPELKKAKELGKSITSATDLWFGELHAPVIGVTGTKGKSTTSSLIVHILKSLDIDARIAGNIGQSPLDLLGVSQPKWWVLELSSYQTSDLNYSPDIGVLTNLSPEHLDWHGSYETYVKDKLNMFQHNPNIISVINALDRETQKYEKQIPSRLRACGSDGVYFANGSFWLRDRKLFDRELLQLVGSHNGQLACLALTAVACTGVDLVARAGDIAQLISTFEALPHRLNSVAEVNGVLYIDDSLSTTPVASRAAIESFHGKEVTILLGGHDRGLSYDELAEYLSLHPLVKVITLPDSGPRIAHAIQHYSPASQVTQTENLQTAVAEAFRITPKGGVVLLSPGAPSFGHFKDYAERGNSFALEVAKLATSINS